MKNLYINDILTKIAIGEEIQIDCWISAIRKMKNMLFLDACDHTGNIQVVYNGENSALKLEQSVSIRGVLQNNPNGDKEIVASNIKIIGDVKKNLNPSPRSNFDIFDPKYTNYVQENRHLFIRNPKAMAALKARHFVKRAVHDWFLNNEFTEITAPILTPILLYTEDTGIAVNVNNQDVFLTQCVAFYLESAVHAFERVYNIGPSFRGAESISPRHLTEYWHVKAEVGFCSFEEIFGIVEAMLNYIVDKVEPQSTEIFKILGTKPVFDEVRKAPFPRIKYRDAIELCKKNGIEAEFGKSLSSEAETFLTKYFDSPVWVTHNARSIEGFPYKICDFDREVTYTADLIGSCGGGEILGVADKILDYDELCERLKEKGKDTNFRYEWFKELRDFGTIPHCGIGMGLERLIKWLFRLPHVREAMPFPRSMGRKIYP